MSRLLWICFGGGLGTGARYGLSSWALQRWGAAFPYGTLGVNLLGSFLVAVVMHVGLSSDALSPTLRLALTTGVLGGFTTYSSFSYETLRLFEAGEWRTGAVYTLVTLLGCLAACALGLAAGRAFVGR
jgi:fluoride exporter